MYGDNIIRQLMGGRKNIRFIYFWDEYETDGHSIVLDFVGKAIPDSKRVGSSEEMEDGEIRFDDDGFRFSAKVELYNLENGDEEDIMGLNTALRAHKSGSGTLYIYPHYDPLYTTESQNRYKVYESGGRSPTYMHEFLPNAQVFPYLFEGVNIDDGILKRVTLVTAATQLGGGYVGLIY